MLKTLLKKSAFLYALVGVANTILGYCVMFVLAYCGVWLELANIIGTIFGILSSYFLNKKFTFKSQNSHKHDFSRFCVAMILAYSANLVALLLCFRILGLDKYVSLVISGIFYTATGYFVSKFWAFKGV